MIEPAKRNAAKQFGANAAAYATSDGHANGTDLEIVVRLAAPGGDDVALDVATGAGHTALALAPHVARVVAADLAPEMLEQVRQLAAKRGLGNIDTQLCDVENMPFDDGAFDIVVCRIAPHHFVDLQASIQEMTRVLRPGGRMVVEDSCAPDDPELEVFINTLERLRDPTHVHSHSEQSWVAMFHAAGTAVLHTEMYRKRHDIESWMDRSGLLSHDRDRVLESFVRASDSARRHFAIEYVDHRPVAYTDDKLIMVATRPTGEPT